MTESLQLLIVGFLLTTVAGSVIGYVLQNRTWRHQFDVQQRAVERSAAQSVLNELADLLDKRRYRMLRLHWRLGGGDAAAIEAALETYRKVLEEWNDGLNRRLALISTHFGADLKADLESLYELHRQTGLLLETNVRRRQQGEQTRDISQLEELLQALNFRNYAFVEKGLDLLLDGHIGSHMTQQQRRRVSVVPPNDV